MDLSAGEKQTIIQHLEELRNSLLISVVAIIIGAVASFAYSEQILAFLIKPLMLLNETPIATGVTEAFFVKLKISFISGFILAFPIVVWAVWRFFRPALYPTERKYFYILFPISIILFSSGILFSYFVVLRVILEFFILIAGQNIETMFKIDQYISFILTFTIPFGLIFQLPVVVFFLTKIGVIKYQMLAKNRKYALLIIVVLAAAITPADPLSNLLMSVPTFFLYEVSIWVSKWSSPNKERKEKGSKFFGKKKEKEDEADEEK
ncbi:twin-arginine translocase subunit TatC [Candidatus Syntrophocurvum alkaliphilum]|nr:twin-arginine translocase subunit TatC [Candidatus Syntrophocurvum alkaliphilum]